MKRVLFVKPDSVSSAGNSSSWPDGVDVVHVDSSRKAIELLQKQNFDAVHFALPPDDSEEICSLLESELLIDQIPDGIALLDKNNVIVRTNQRLTNWFENQQLVGLNFYEALGRPDILGPEPTPLGTCSATGTIRCATLQTSDRFYQLNVAPILDGRGDVRYLIATLRDATESTQQRQKLEALREAGIALADLRPEEIFEMDVDDRVELLKQNILHYTKDLLNFDVCEIRLLEQKTDLLVPLLSEGIDAEASKRPLYGREKGNGVTGFVVATGNSYLCEDTTNDPLYVDGLIGAKSSLTVPLKYHDKVIGSFNVESPETGAFDEEDLQFLESFARDVAVSLNTLELLNAQRTNTAQQSVEAIHGAVALPIDEILNDTVQVMENYIGHNELVTERLKNILKNARDIKQVIQKVGQSLAPSEAVPAGVQIERRPTLTNRRVLVIDADESVRTSAHKLLERFGCVVETAQQGKEALMMIRNCDKDDEYQAILADIRLPDIGGYELLMQLKEFNPDPPLILMTGFGYDPGHSIVKARRAGLSAGSVLYKPFRLDQLLETVESVISPPANTERPASAESSSVGNNV